MNHRGGRYRSWGAVVVLVLLAAAATASLLPLLETNTWWVRYLDFPRLQFAVATVVLLALYLGLRRRLGTRDGAVILAALIVLGYHAYKLHPYTGLVEPAAVTRAECSEADSVRIMIANVKRRNEQARAFLDQVDRVDPDLLLVMETDAGWDERLRPLRKEFPRRVQSIPEDHAFYGMHFFSKLEMIQPEFRFFFDAATPTLDAEVRLRNGEPIRFLGLHPRPPLAWSQPTTMRDAHILEASLMTRGSDAPTVLAGDFNAVPWERVTRRAMRVGSLLDPRVGRGLFPTYDTESYLMSWPLDQILFQPQFTVLGFDALPDFGSDHRAVVATLCHDPAAVQAAPDLLPDDLAEAERSIDAARRNAATE